MTLRLLTAAALMSVVAISWPAWADEPDSATLFATGQRHFSDGKFEESRTAYFKAWKLTPSYDVAANLGNVELQLGRTAEAAAHLTYAINHLPATMDEATRSNVSQKIQAKLGEALSQLGKLAILTTPANGQITLDGKPITIDGDVASSEQTASGWFVARSEHTLAATLDGHAPLEQQIVV